MCRFLCGHEFSTPLGKYQGLSNKSVWLCKKQPNCFPKWLYHFTSPPEMNEFLLLHESSQAFGAVFWIWAMQIRYIVVSPGCFNLHFPNSIYCEAPFHMLIFHLHIFFSNYLLRSLAQFLMRLFVFLLLNFFKNFLIFLMFIFERQRERETEDLKRALRRQQKAQCGT